MKSSLYFYVIKLFAGKGGYKRLDFTQRKAAEQRGEDTSNYALLIPVTSNQAHTEQFYHGNAVYRLMIDREEFRPHLRIDDTYHSAFSEYKHRRYLSFCHGTEHFISEQSGNVIHVRYHFNQTGECVRIVCTSDAGEEIPGIDLQDRADIYTEKLKTFINGKNNEYLRIQTAISSKLAELELMHSDKDAMIHLINEIIELAHQRTTLEDHPSDAPKIPLVALLEQRRSVLMTATRATVESHKSATAATTATEAIATTPNKSETSKKKPPIAQGAKTSVVITEAQQEEIDTCKKTITLLNKLRNEGLTASKVDLYVTELGKVSESLLMLPECDATNKLWKILELLPSALQLFQDAISTGNLELARSLHPHCKDRIDETFYFDLFAKWVCDIKDEELILKMRAVFDYLFQNCDIFKSCLQALQSVLPTTGNYSASFLFIAIVKKRRVALEALLAYGFSPNGILSYNASTKKVDSALDTITALPNDEFKAFVIKLLMEHGFDPRYKVITEPVRDSSSHLKQVASKLAVQIHQRFKFSYYVDREFNPLSHYCHDVRRVTPELRDFLIVKSSMHDLLDSLVQFYSSMGGSHFEAHSSVPGIRLHILGDRVQKTPGDFICLHVFFSNKLELEHIQAVLNEINNRRRTAAPDNSALLEMQAKAQEFAARNKHRLAARTFFSIAMYFLTSIQKLTENDVKEIIKNLALAGEQMLKHAPEDNQYDIRKRQEFVYSSTLLAMEIATACKQKIDDTLVGNLQAIFPELPPNASSYVLGKLEHLNLTAVKEILRANSQGATKLSKGPGQ